MAKLQYNPQGQLEQIHPLFAAAAAVGQGAGTQRQQALDANFLSQELSRRAQLRTHNDAMLMDAMKLQQAGQRLMPQATAQSSGGSQPSFMPLSSSVKAAKSLAKTSKLAGLTLTPDQQRSVDQLESADDVSPDRFVEALDQIVQGAKQQQTQQQTQEKQQKAVQEKEQKVAFARTLAGEFPDTSDEGRTVRDQLRAMVNDPETSLTQMRTAINQLRSQRQSAKRGEEQEQRSVQAFERGVAESDRRSARERAEKIREELLAEGINPDGGEDQPALQEPSHYGTFDWIETDDEEASAANKARLKTQLQEYRRLQQSALSSQTGGSASPAASTDVRPGPGQVKARVNGRIVIMDKATGQIVQELQ